MKWIRIPLLLLLLQSCSPILGAGSLLHAMATGNTTAQVIGVTDIVVERNTGKSIKEHAWKQVTSNNTPKTRPTHIEWIFHETRNENK